MSDVFNFVVHNQAKWTSLGSKTDLDPSRFPALFGSNEDVWIVLTYLQLRRRGLRATVSQRPLPKRINVVDGIHLGPKDAGPNVFLIGCRGDGPYPALCQIVLHQNTLRLADPASFYVPQWTQPGLIGRNPGRRGVRAIGFFGHAAVNLDVAFQCDGFRSKLTARGCELVIHDRRERSEWHDYSKVDLTLSVRNIPYRHLLLKPANKLINSWCAHTPAIIGPEPAVQALRRSSLDCFEARRPSQVVDILALLEREPEIYQRMVAHGRVRAIEYADDMIAARWLRILKASRALFIRWSKLSPAEMDHSYRARLSSQLRALHRHEREVHQEYWRAGFERRWWESRQPPPRSVGEETGITMAPVNAL